MKCIRRKEFKKCKEYEEETGLKEVACCLPLDAEKETEPPCIYTFCTTICFFHYVLCTAYLYYTLTDFARRILILILPDNFPFYRTQTVTIHARRFYANNLAFSF